MTSETYNRVMKIMTDQEIYKFAQRICEHYQFDPIKEYPQTCDSEILSGSARRMLYLHKASNLLRKAVFLGGTNLEIFKICQYLVVLMKAVDNKLDFRLCEKETDISELNRKYSDNNFLALDVDVDELEKVLERDKDYYEVSIKNEDR